MNRSLFLAVAIVLSTIFLHGKAQAQAPTPVYPTAIFAFSERGADVEGLGALVADLVFANLVVDPNMYLVDREDMKKILQEQELTVSGLVNPAQAVQVGQLTGARLLITGSVIQAGDKIILVAKVIGTETSRVSGASIKGSVDQDIDEIVERLSVEIIATINKNSKILVPKPASRKKSIASLKKKLKGTKLPVIQVSIKEQHVGRGTIDPAAETEFIFYLRGLGFEVIDSTVSSGKKADINIIGEGFSEFTARVGALAPVKARLEVKAIDVKTGRIIAIDRQTSVAVDLNELIAGKTALQNAAAKVAQRMIPQLVQPKKP
ncbi:MAG: hypothetical protein COA78_13050 [Blastopirellula sp.]|nr:MAG: hypothetical protein COA78_13050 [Blastopirellula sp.]